MSSPARFVLNAARDAYRYFLFPLSCYRGIYGSFEEAEAAAPKGKRIGYNHADYARSFVPNPNDLALESYDYPILFHLERILKHGSVIVDFGGNVGIHYLRYRRYLNLEKITWVIWDLPEITKVGREVCTGIPNVEFINDPAELNRLDVCAFIASGSMQYVGSPEILLKKLIERGASPKHVLVNRLPLYDGPQFVTLQNAGNVCYPQYIFNRAEYQAGIAGLGYDFTDGWYDDIEGCYIPFHADKSFRSCSGLFYSRKM